jgi:hypothetical protein
MTMEAAPLLPVPERMTGVGGPLAPVHRGQQEPLVERVRGRVSGFGEHGAGAHHDPRGQLDRTDQDIGGACDE